MTDAQKYDGVLLGLAQQMKGGVPQLFDVLFNFLSRKTDFYTGAGVYRAKELLLLAFYKNAVSAMKIIDEEDYVEFGLGKNKGAAISYVTNLMPELSTAKREADSSENWIDKLINKCRRLKLRAAIYDVEDRGSAIQHVFVATCSVCKLVTSGQGGTKKAAKKIAAEEMFKKLELSTEWEEEKKYELEQENEDEKPFEIVKGGFSDMTTLKQDRLLKAVLEQEQSPQLNPPLEKEQVVEESLEKCLYEAQLLAGSTDGLRNGLQRLLDEPESAVSEVFTKQQLQYTVFSKPNADGDVLCLLKVLDAKGETNVFGGTGRTENAARNNAARLALLYLSVFMI